MKLVLFDFDGTITTKDTLFEFVRFAVGGGRFVAGMIWLSPMLAAHKCGLITAQKAKERMLNHFLGGRTKNELSEIAQRFVQERVPAILRADVFGEFREFIKGAHQVSIVTASCETWIRPFAEQHGADLLATKMEFDKSDAFTGRFATPNCKGPEKAKRIRDAYNLSAYSEIIAYGNSSGDNEMFELATVKKLING